MAANSILISFVKLSILPLMIHLRLFRTKHNRLTLTT
jgi:hypothetical protein